MFTERALRLIAEAKIEQAIEDGQFDQLPGLGKPFAFDDTHYDPYWWIRRKLERERLTGLQQEFARQAAQEPRR